MKKIKYFIEFLFVISFCIIFKLIGCYNASFLGGIIGRFIGPLFRSRKIIEKNLNIALGEISNDKREKIIGNMWSNYGKTFAEYVYLKTFKNSRKNNHIKIHGFEILEKIKKSNEPVVFFSGHFGNFELMAMEIEKANIKLAAIYRPLNNIFLNPLMEYLRIKYICPNQIPKGRKGSREIIKKVKNGYSIAIMVDQSVTEGRKIPFFKKLASTTIIPAQLALKYNCKLVGVFLERKTGINFEMTIEEPFSIEKTNNNEEDLKKITEKINNKIEKMIIKNPNQWIWSHNRWK